MCVRVFQENGRPQKHSPLGLSLAPLYAPVESVFSLRWLLGNAPKKTAKLERKLKRDNKKKIDGVSGRTEAGNVS